MQIIDTLKRYVGHLIPLSAFALLFLALSLPAWSAEKEQLSVTRDKDKTVYSIGSDDESRKEEEKKQERSWEMLKNMPIIMDRPAIIDRPVNKDRRAPEPARK